jgi:hypothetical protein
MEYVVNFFAEPLIDYGKLIEEQSKVEAPNPIYTGHKKI